MSDKPGGCSCNQDPFASLPPELQPQKKSAFSDLRNVVCPGCGLKYWTNRKTDLCIECVKRAGTTSPAREAPKPETESGGMKMLSIKVLGPGCANCKKVEQIAHEAVDALGTEAYIEKITEYAEIHKYPILATPGLVVNEKLVCAGRIPTVAEVTTWLTSALS